MKLAKYVDNSGVTKKKGVKRISSCARITNSRNITLGNLNTINSNKLHYWGYRPDATKSSIGITKLVEQISTFYVLIAN